MEVQHVHVKFFVDGELSVDLERFIEIFHTWVSEQSTDELLIDVADYRHVPNGPGVVLVGHEADYAMDNTAGRWGLVYVRKAAVSGSNADRFAQALQCAANACRRLVDATSGSLKFKQDELQVQINDRALAPNTAETQTALRPELESSLEGILGNGDFSLEHDSDPRARFGVTLSTSTPFDLEALSSCATT